MSIRTKLDELHVLNQRLAKLLDNAKENKTSLITDSDKAGEVFSEFEQLVADGKQLKEDIQTLMAVDKEEEKGQEEPEVVQAEPLPTEDKEENKVAEEVTQNIETEEKETITTDEPVVEETSDVPAEPEEVITEEQEPNTEDQKAEEERLEQEHKDEEERLRREELIKEEMRKAKEEHEAEQERLKAEEQAVSESVTTEEAHETNHPAEVKDITTSPYYTDTSEEYVLKGNDVRLLGDQYSFSCARCGKTVNGASGGDWNILANSFKAAPKIMPKEHCKADLNARVVLCDSCAKTRGEDGYWTTSPVTFLLENADGKLQKNSLIADGVYDTEASELLNAIMNRAPKQEDREKCHMMFKQRFR